MEKLLLLLLAVHVVQVVVVVVEEEEVEVEAGADHPLLLRRRPHRLLLRQGVFRDILSVL